MVLSPNQREPLQVPITHRLAHLAVMALIDEAELTPKPALVDQRGSGAHADLTLVLMRQSAHALAPMFATFAKASINQVPDQAIRERLGTLGREGERTMLAATNGVNTHRGAIWAVGLLVAGAAITGCTTSAREIANCAGELARIADRWAPELPSHGRSMHQRYGAAGARGEAQRNFWCVVEVGLPTLQAARQHGEPETCARLDALVAIMAHLDDTCLLYRGGPEALRIAKEGAEAILHAGGTCTTAGRDLLRQLDLALLRHRASPGGSADLLAATLFLDALTREHSPNEGEPLWNV